MPPVNPQARAHLTIPRSTVLKREVVAIERSSCNQLLGLRHTYTPQSVYSLDCRERNQR